MIQQGLSIVIVNWNTRERLLGLIDTLTKVRFKHSMQIVVVDNASSDGSVDAVQTAFPQVTLRPQSRNLGFGAGANRGVAAAKFDTVLLLNTDVEFDENAIQTLYGYAERHPYAAIIGPRIVDGAGRPQCSHWKTPSLASAAVSAFALHRLKPAAAPSREAKAVDCVSGCVFLVRRDAFVRLGGFDEDFFMYFEETDLCRRARAAGHAVHYAPVATFMHEGGGSGHQVRQALFSEFRYSEILFHRKHAGELAAVAMRGLSIAGLAWRACAFGALCLTPTRAGLRARSKFLLNARGLRALLTGKQSTLRATSRPGLRAMPRGSAKTSPQRLRA